MRLGEPHLSSQKPKKYLVLKQNERHKEKAQEILNTSLLGHVPFYNNYKETSLMRPKQKTSTINAAHYLYFYM